MTKTQKIIIIALMSSLITSNATAVKVSTLHSKVAVLNIEPSEDVHWEIIGSSKPIYSKELAVAKYTGCAITSFEISDTGSTSNVKIVKAVPSRKVNRHLYKIMRKVKWRAVEKGTSPESQQRTIRLDFCMSDVSNYDVQQQCREMAKLPCE